MIEKLFTEKFNQPLAVALGFFDSIHIGHRIILQKVKEKAEAYGCRTACITFKNNPYPILKEDIKLIYTYSERLQIFESLNLDLIISSDFDYDFSQIAPQDFLNALTLNFNIKHIVCGYDYRFGRLGLGDTMTLQNFCKEKGIGIDVTPKAVWQGLKISSTLIRQKISEGDIVTANNLLSEPYFLTGSVVRGKNIGSRLLYPTVNIQAAIEKLPPAEGVYATFASVLGKKYLSVTNCGKKPTFGDERYSVETHILNFDSDIYGKQVKLIFITKIRDIIKFKNIEELKLQIGNDIEAAKKILSEIK